MNKVSIIIPCISINQQTKKCIKECLNLTYDNFEILVLPDEFKEKVNIPKLKIIPTGKVKPALKRNIAMDQSDADYYAFIDDDAYPNPDWLTKAITYLESNQDIGIVGGPNLTPKEANLAEHISGYVLSNPLISGPASIRYKPAENKFVRELPSCNYISCVVDF